jgi:hypothetical protein
LQIERRTCNLQPATCNLQPAICNLQSAICNLQSAMTPMPLQPGCRFVVAPHFHLPADWPRRLRVGAGVEEAGGRFFPRPSWRPPTPDELPFLVRASDGPTPPEEPEDCVCLFQLPGHLRSEWWQLLEQAAEVFGDGRLPGFETFASRVGEFLAFKSLPVPEGARCEVVVSNPVRPFVAGSEANRPGGLRCNLAPWAPWPCSEEHRWPRLWGGINLGDEETSVVLINRPCRQLDAELHRRSPDQPAPAAVGELAVRFLRSCPDYPPVRLTLGPGEGYRLPRGGLILDGYLGDKQEPDVLLWISPEGTRSA